MSSQKPNLEEQLLTIQKQKQIFDQLNTSNLSDNISPLRIGRSKYTAINYNSPTSLEWTIQQLEEQLEVALKERNIARADNISLKEKIEIIEKEYKIDVQRLRAARDQSTQLLEESKNVASINEQKEIRIKELVESKKQLERKVTDLTEREFILKRRIRELENQHSNTKSFYEEKVQALERHYIQLKQMITDQRDKHIEKGRLDQKYEMRMKNYDIENNILKSQNESLKQRIEKMHDQINQLKTQHLRSNIKSQTQVKSVESEFAGYIKAQATEIETLRQRLTSEKAKNSDYYQSLLVNM